MHAISCEKGLNVIHIRKPTESDSSELEVLFQTTRQHTFVGRPKDEFQIGDYQKSTSEDDVWIAEQKGIIVGFVSIYPLENFLHNLCIHPKYQQKGIGSRLLKIAEEHLLRPMTLKIAMDNLKVCGFYEKYGWFKMAQYDQEEEPCVLYRKD